MKRIYLSKKEREVFLLVRNKKGCPQGYPHHIYVSSVRSLQRKGLVVAHWSEEVGLAVATVSDEGEEYFATNPTLRNPIDWKWIISTGIALAAAIIAFIALFVACAKLK